MAIPVSQLGSWCRQGAKTSSEKTYHSIEFALRRKDSPLNGINFEIYLQGSYRNDTNIKGDSDVDVVVQLNSTYEIDDSNLNLFERMNLRKGTVSALYNFPDFRSDVLKSLNNYYGFWNIIDGNKSIKLRSSNYLGADIIPCLKFIKFIRYSNNIIPIEGIKFYGKNFLSVINYPKFHYHNGAQKNKDTGGAYKPFVRLFKNARTFLEEHYLLTKGTAPSYFVECLLFNVPDNLFTFKMGNPFPRIISYLAQTDLTPFICQNRMLPLFGNTPEQWSITSAYSFITALNNLWNGGWELCMLMQQMPKMGR